MIPAAADLAVAFRYPEPGAAERLTAAVERIPAGSVRRHLQRFADAVTGLPLSRWEELHTDTLDLGPLVTPYVGHVIWADNYQRGAFMAELAAAQAAAGVDPAGELPDHLEPVLRYLAVTETALEELIEVLPRALQLMEQSLRRADADNPYRFVLAACIDLVGDLPSAAPPPRRRRPDGGNPPIETPVRVGNGGGQP